jgi:RNA polymerase sigma factor (sigma-70 family)
VDEAARYLWVAKHILRHRGELCGWLRQRVRSLPAEDIDDLIQEALARIWTVDFSTIRNGRAYLYRTVANLLAEHVRRNRIVPIELLGEIDSLSIISDEPGPDRLVGARQELDRVREIVAELPVQCRRVFELRKFDGLSHREVAQRMGLSEKTVENHLTRALARITGALAASGSPDKAEAGDRLPQSAADSDHGID